MNKATHKKIKKHLKDEYDYEAEEMKDLSLYGFTNISLVSGIPVATLSLGGSVSNFCFYRILNKVHYHHLEKLERLRAKLNERDVRNKLFQDKRADRAMGWFRKVHTEVYQRKNKSYECV